MPHRKLKESVWPELVRIYLEVFGFVDGHPPYRVVYPWVAQRLASLARGSHVLDLGGGITPMPVFFGNSGHWVETVDVSDTVRRLPADETWNGWGFFDYGAINANISSHNCDAVDHVPTSPYHACYSVGMMAHMRRSARERLLGNLLDWLLPGGRLLLAVDLVRSGDLIWNMYRGRPVDAPGEHGTTGDLRVLLDEFGYDVRAFDVLRDMPGSRTDLLLVDCSAPVEQGVSAERISER